MPRRSAPSWAPFGVPGTGRCAWRPCWRGAAGAGRARRGARRAGPTRRRAGHTTQPGRPARCSSPDVAGALARRRGWWRRDGVGVPDDHEALHAVVAEVRHIEGPLAIDREAPGVVELTRLVAVGRDGAHLYRADEAVAPLLEEGAVGGELLHPPVVLVRGVEGAV